MVYVANNGIILKKIQKKANEQKTFEMTTLHHE